MEAVGATFGVILGIAWYGMGLWGLILARQKGHMHWLFGMGLFAFVFYGWVVALIGLLLPLALGPIMWLIAKYVMADKRVPATWGTSPT